MLFKMSEDKKSSTTAEPTIVVAEINSSSVTLARKVPVSKKAVVVAISCVVIVGLLVAGALVGIRLYFDGKTEELKFSVVEKINGMTLNQTAVVDGNILKLTAVANGYKAWLVEDFDKSIQVTKVETSEGTKCYVTALNRTEGYDTSKLPDSPAVANASSNVVRKFTAFGSPITDISYLGKAVEEMCRNVPTYWAMEQCENDSGRQKRAILLEGICCVRCRDLNEWCCFDCVIILFAADARADDPNPVLANPLPDDTADAAKPVFANPVPEDTVDAAKPVFANPVPEDTVDAAKPVPSL